MIYAIGDSFTYGDELPSQNLAWPTLLATKLNKQIINKGRPASGNHRMVKRSVDAVLNNSELIIIGWSDCNRLEFADNQGIFDIWAGRNYGAFQLNDPTFRISLIKYFTAYDIPKYNYANWLRQIILVQNLCKSNKVPCVMFNACGSWESHRRFYHEFENLINGIDQSCFVDGMDNSVAQWTYHTPHGPNGHPLEEGHQIIADKIYEHIRNQCRIS